MARASLKKLFILGNVTIVVWLAFVASQTALSQRKANCELSVYGSLKIDVCGDVNKRQFILVMSIGNVFRSDSLFGFNYQISYNKEKVKITDALYLNTLSEFLDNKTASINSKEGKINGYAITMGMEPVYGNRPLIAFNGQWISDCPDTAIFTIDYIEFTDEFKVEIDTLKPAKLIGDVFVSNDRIFKVSIPIDTMTTTDSLAQMDVNLKIPRNSRLGEFNLNINGFFNKLVIDSVAILGNDFEINSYEYLNGNNFIVKIKNKNDFGQENTLRLYLHFYKPNEIIKISIEPEYEMYCKCISGFTGDSVNAFYKKETSYVDLENNGINIDGYYRFLVYDNIGRLVKEMIIEKPQEIDKWFQILGLSKGIYYVFIENQFSKVIERKIYVNY
jgi:hypothetical protein